jgi:hypothetical protein
VPAKQIPLGGIEAADEREAIERDAAEIRQPASKLMAGGPDSKISARRVTAPRWATTKGASFRAAFAKASCHPACSINARAPWPSDAWRYGEAVLRVR